MRTKSKNPRWKADDLKPKHPFCWICSRRLWGRQFVEIEVDGIKHPVHKQCARREEAAKEK